MLPVFPEAHLQGASLSRGQNRCRMLPFVKGRAGLTETTSLGRRTENRPAQIGAEAKKLEQALAMPDAQVHAEAARYLGPQQPAVPAVCDIAQLARGALENRLQLSHLHAGESRVPSGMTLLLQAIDAMLLE